MIRMSDICNRCAYSLSDKLIFKIKSLISLFSYFNLYVSKIIKKLTSKVQVAINNL